MKFTVPVNNDAHGNAIVCQFRARPPTTKDRSNDDNYTIPPMTMCFSDDTYAVNRAGPDVLDVHACADCGDASSKRVFRGVSLQGVRGKEARRPGESRNRVTLYVRGKVTIMCNAETLSSTNVGDAVGYDTTKQIVFAGFEGTPVMELVKVRADSRACIGTLVNKGDRRHRVNCATVLLK